MARGRPRKQKKVVVKHDCNDLFKLITDLIHRDLTDEESGSVAKACFTFVKENYTPIQVFDDATLKEDVIVNQIVSKKDFDDFDDEDYDDFDGKGHGWGKQFTDGSEDDE